MRLPNWWRRGLAHPLAMGETGRVCSLGCSNVSSHLDSGSDSRLDSGLNSGFGVYVHWPYCAAICPYCDFNVYRQRDDDAGALVEAICADIAGWRAKIGPRVAQTVFFGGGTPSLMDPGDVARVLGAVDAAFGLAGDAEISLEANPEHVSVDGVKAFHRAGVNRVSLGVQALRDDGLVGLGRAHSAAEARAGVLAALEVVGNVSLDLIYGREGQGLSAWADELGEALALGVPHVSAYQLTIEPGTAFERRAARGGLVVPDDDASADFFDLTRRMCGDAGYGHYEISNYARDVRHQSRHNLVYWTSGEWLGVGPGAHGRVWMDGVRHASSAVRLPGDYAMRVGASGLGVDGLEALDGMACGREYVLMGLRLARGISRARYGQLAGAELAADGVAALLADGLVAVEGDRLWVGDHARALTERIAAELVEA